MPEVWFAIPGDPDTLTGGYIYARRLTTALSETEWKPRILQLPSGFPDPSDEDLEKTRQQFEALPTDAIVLVDGLAYGAMPRALIEGLSLRFVALVHHPLALETGLPNIQSRRRKASERIALSLARFVIATSPHTAGILEKDYAVPPDRLCVALPGTAPAPRATPNDATPHLLTVATLTRRKGYDVLVDALTNLIDLPWQCVSVGSLTREPDITSSILTMVQRRKLTKRIEFRGEIDTAALEAEYHRASIFVLPSRYEGYGMAFAEALAHGLPIVACAVGAVVDTVPDEAGLLVPPNDSEAVSKALRRLLSDRVLRIEMSDASWRHAKLLPSWQDTAAAVASALTAAMR